MVDELALVGVRLRALRQARGWTLDELASRAGMSPSTLSRLESGKRQASLELLLPLTRLLGARIDDLVQPAAVDPRVRRAAVRRDGIVMTPLTQESAPIHAYKITYPPTPTAPAPRTHDGYEWVFVLSGRLRLVLGEQELVLTRAEAAEFDTRTPHSLSAAGSRPAEVVSIFNDDGERMHTRTADG